jgi:hypothetical protein
MITAITDAHPKPLLDLAQVLIELTAKIRQHLVVGRLHQELPGFYSSIQELKILTLYRKADKLAAVIIN